MKKAEMSLEQVVKMIIFIMVLLLAISLIFAFLSAGKDSVKDKTCKSSIALAKRAEQLNDKSMVLSRITLDYKCPAPDLELDGNNPDAVSFQINRQLAKCWDKTGGLDSGIGIVEGSMIEKGDYTNPM